MGRYQVPRVGWLRAARGQIAAIAVIALTAGALFTPTASAATGTTIYSSSGSGYRVSGRWFDYIKTEIQLPTNAECARLYKVIHPGAFSVSVGLGNPNPSVQLIISDVPTSTRCGRYTARLDNAGMVTPGPFAMSPGDRILMSVVYAPSSPLIGGQHSVSGHLLNLTRGDGSTIADLASKTYTTAQVIGGFGSFTAPSSRFRAFEFTESAAQTYTGHKGTLTGPWTTSQVVMTSNGRSSGTVKASSPVLWNGGRNFGTWVR
jgi:hypothetical protein